MVSHVAHVTQVPPRCDLPFASRVGCDRPSVRSQGRRILPWPQQRWSRWCPQHLCGISKKEKIQIQEQRVKVLAERERPQVASMSFACFAHLLPFMDCLEVGFC
ncbi:hypothetical protein GN956_G6471 [Arapaima gigas]